MSPPIRTGHAVTSCHNSQASQAGPANQPPSNSDRRQKMQRGREGFSTLRHLHLLPAACRGYSLGLEFWRCHGRLQPSKPCCAWSGAQRKGHRAGLTTRAWQAVLPLTRRSPDPMSNGPQNQSACATAPTDVLLPSEMPRHLQRIHDKSRRSLRDAAQRWSCWREGFIGMTLDSRKRPR